MPRQNRKEQENDGRTLYKNRNPVERFFNKLKHFRHVASRYGKRLVNFRGFVKIAVIAVLMRSLKCHDDLGS
ncbi:MAG: transposase [Magnetovibrio sp.]|nr:transposase [Magnetovibrio sp.]